MLHTIEAVLPGSLRKIFSRLPADIIDSLEEMRIREQRPLEIIYKGGFAFVSANGTALDNADKAYRATRDDCRQLLDLLTNHSLYTLEEELRRGFVTIAGGHRVGLAGRTVVERGKVKLIREISAFNIRIARPVIGCGQSLLPLLADDRQQTLHHTLVLSPPQMGKTTLIRDLARLISHGQWGKDRQHWRARKVGIVDERSEIAASRHGVPQFDIGPRTDVLDRCPKAEGMMMMIRSMSPEVMVVDEIGAQADAEAVKEAANAGIRVLATAHALHFEDILSRPMFTELTRSGTFSRYVLLKRTTSGFRLNQVLDQNGRLISAATTLSRNHVL